MKIEAVDRVRTSLPFYQIVHITVMLMSGDMYVVLYVKYVHVILLPIHCNKTHITAVTYSYV